MKNIFVYSNGDRTSLKTKGDLIKLLNGDFNVLTSYNSKVDFIVSIGGDGTFLRALKQTNYASKPILGINTGHLGFFADYNPKELKEVVEAIKKNTYKLQTYKTIKTSVELANKKLVLKPALNDVYIKHGKSSIAHLDVLINDRKVECIAADGLLISSSAGSTAYNYSLGGGIVDPELDLLQVRAVAANNNAVYRSLVSSLLLPKRAKLAIIPRDKDNTVIVIDGEEISFNGLKKVEITLANRKINIVRKSNYSFWQKVNSKFI